MSPDFSVFQEPEALRINRVRQEHLSSLGLELHGKSVLEVGAGIGLHTAFFEERGCDVLSTDGNPANVAEMLRLYPHRKLGVLDLDRVVDLADLGSFDIVYCYGTLYHLRARTAPWPGSPECVRARSWSRPWLFQGVTPSFTVSSNRCPQIRAFAELGRGRPALG